MASNKKTASAPKKAPAILKGTAAPAKTAETAPTKAADAPAQATEAAPAKAADATPAKAEGGETAGAAPKNYSRGEGQKPVTQAYKDNWNAIFGNDTTKKKNR
jgi:hypothetical protein